MVTCRPDWPVNAPTLQVVVLAMSTRSGQLHFLALNGHGRRTPL